jgi:hypothetical protein
VIAMKFKILAAALVVAFSMPGIAQAAGLPQTISDEDTQAIITAQDEALAGEVGFHKTIVIAGGAIVSVSTDGFSRGRIDENGQIVAPVAQLGFTPATKLFTVRYTSADGSESKAMQVTASEVGAMYAGPRWFIHSQRVL